MVCKVMMIYSGSWERLTCVDFDKVVIALVLEDFVVAVWNVEICLMRDHNLDCVYNCECGISIRALLYMEIK